MPCARGDTAREREKGREEKKRVGEVDMGGGGREEGGVEGREGGEGKSLSTKECLNATVNERSALMSPST